LPTCSLLILRSPASVWRQTELELRAPSISQRPSRPTARLSSSTSNPMILTTLPKPSFAKPREATSHSFCKGLKLRARVAASATLLDMRTGLRTGGAAQRCGRRRAHAGHHLNFHLWWPHTCGTSCMYMCTHLDALALEFHLEFHRSPRACLDTLGCALTVVRAGQGKVG